MKRTMLIRGLAVAAALLLSATTASVATAAGRPEHANPRYVALGDSFASGYGAGSYLDACGRSLLGYPALLAEGNSYQLDFQACAGATTDDVLTKQLGTLDARTELVTITIGGNDAGFSSLVAACGSFLANECESLVGWAEATTSAVLPGRLDALFADIRLKAKRAKVIVTNYPHLFNGTNCGSLTFTAGGMAALNHGADVLSDLLSAAAARAGFEFADVRRSFAGHAACDTVPWINAFDAAHLNDAYHPNAAGYAGGYEPAVAGVLDVKKGGGPMSVTTGGITSSDTTRGQVRITR